MTMRSRVQNIMSATRKYTTTRQELVQGHECCPQRPYLELTVPKDARTVTAASFTTVSRDQGWADDKHPYTWFEINVCHPDGGTSDLLAIRIHHNRAGNPKYYPQTTCWDTGHARPSSTKWVRFFRLVDKIIHSNYRRHPQSRSHEWLRSLQPGDIIQIIPKAVYPCWVNFVKEATISIEYQSVGDAHIMHLDRRLSLPSNHYHPLDDPGKQIRVLVVKRGKYHDPIEAFFAHTSLVEPWEPETGFDALSYCWGHSPERVDIQIDTGKGETARASNARTVERAIRRLRPHDRCLRIWIDAVCINQADSNERSQQVGIMGSIYSRARTVHIWLDEDDPAIGAALRVIREIHNYKHLVCPGGKECNCPGTRHTLRPIDLKKGASRGTWSSCEHIVKVLDHHGYVRSFFDKHAIAPSGHPRNMGLAHLIQNLLQHPWFQRVWVLQEATLSQQTTLVHGAQETITWTELLTVNCCLENLQPSHIRGQLRMPAIWKTLSGSDDSDNQGREPLSILEVFLAALDMKASDCRDKLFALLVFGKETCDEIPPAIRPAALRPDYNKSPEKVMADFARWWIREYRSLDILSFVHCDLGRAWHRTLGDLSVKEGPPPIPRPSWALGTEGVPGWASMTLLKQFPTFRASADTVPDEELLEEEQPDRLVLRLQGFKLGSILAMSHCYESLPRPDTEEHGCASRPDQDLATPNTSAVFHSMFDTSGCTGLWCYPGTGRADGKAQQATPDAARAADHAAAHYKEPMARQVRVILSIRLALMSLRSGPETPWWYDRFPDQIEVPACVDRCFFAVSDGSYGVCPWTVREGDVVSVLYGGKIPFVLRPVPPPDHEHDGAPTYELVGECFVDRAEVMNGEFIKKRMEMSDWKSEIFTLV